MKRRIAVLILTILLTTLAGGCGILGGLSHDDRQEGNEGNTSAIREGPVRCPVSGEVVDAEEAFTYVHQGETLYFCCGECIAKFKKDPDRYLQEQSDHQGG